jgi:hypothetical protein
MEEQQNHLTLQTLMIAAPCEVEWDDMAGDDKVRRCNECKLNVINIKALTSKEIEKVLQSDQAKNGRLCVQLYRRADGTLLTADCPRGLQKIRAASARLWRTVAAAVALFVGGNPGLAQTNDNTASPKDKATQPMQRTAGMVAPPTVGKNQPKPEAEKPEGQNKGGQEKTSEPETNTHVGSVEDTHQGKAHYTAFNLYKEGQQLEKSGQYAKAAAIYQQALTLMSTQKHDPKFHLKIATALSRVKAKAGMNQ